LRRTREINDDNDKDEEVKKPVVAHVENKNQEEIKAAILTNSPAKK